MGKRPNSPPVTVATQEPLNPEYPYFLSYIALRTIIGIIGITLPFVLILGKLLFDSPGVLPSISAYYYSVMRDVFVGSMCAAGVFLISYRFDWWSDRAADVAGFAAIGIALFPTPPVGGGTQQQTIIGYAHSVFSGVFFVTLAVIAFFLFPRMDPFKEKTEEKQRRNVLYRVSGVIMFVCIAILIATLFLQNATWLQSLHPGIYLETLAILSFGVAWFVKGGTLLPSLLKDKGQHGGLESRP